VIQINWALNSATKAPTTGSSASSSSPFVVQTGAIDHLNNHVPAGLPGGPKVDTDNIVVRFLARKKGTAKLTFIIRRTPTDASTVTSEVEVR
jgi:hypothetical protein